MKIKRIINENPALLFAVAGLIAPFFLSDYVVGDILVKAMIFGLLAVSLDLAWGYTGILSLGHAAFFGFGAYLMGIVLLNWSSPFTMPVAIIIGILGPTLLAALVGLVLFYTKTSELYIAVFTLSLSILFPQLLLRVPQWTGGLNGLSGIPLFPFSVKEKYYFVFSIVIVVIFVLFKIVRSDFGRLLIAVRDNEDRIRSLGFNTAFIRLIAFTLSGAVSGFASVLFPPQNGFISHSLPGFVTSTNAIVWTAIGGRGTLVGPFLGTVLINWISPLLNAQFPHLWQLFLGLIFIAVIIVFPGGIYSLVLRFFPVLKKFSLIPRAFTSRSEEMCVLAIKDLKVGYGSLEVLRGINYEVRSKQLQCLIGPNGAGKSTLVGAISGNIAPSAGQVLFGGIPLQRKSPQFITRKGLARTFQTANLFDTLTVGENILLATYRGNLPSIFHQTNCIQVPESVNRIIELSGLQDKLSIPASLLGHGERKWLELILVLCTEPRMVLLDEPTAGLTTAERIEVGALLKELTQEAGLGLLLIEHDIDFVKSIAQEIAVLVDGIIIASGSVEQVVNNPKVNELYLGDIRS